MQASPNIPVVTGTQMGAVDRAMVEVCGLELVQVMEVAGRAVAVAARHLLAAGSVALLCGSGGNGGDALVCARYLVGWGYTVQCWLARPGDQMSGLAAHQLQICQRLGIPIRDAEDPIDLGGVDLIVDGVFGFGLSATPTGRAAHLIDAANLAQAPTLAIDIPSGVDATTGAAYIPAIVAEHTLTLGLPKQGLLASEGTAHAGAVIVADIGIPAAAYAAVGIPRTSIFAGAEFVTLDGRPWPS